MRQPALVVAIACAAVLLPLLLGQSSPSTLELSGRVIALQKENDEFKAKLEALETKIAALEQENAALRRLLNPKTQPATATKPATRPTTKSKAGNDQDGPGLYRVTAGRFRKFSADIRASSRQDALNQGLKTVAKKAMDFDENSEIGEMTVEKLGN